MPPKKSNIRGDSDLISILEKWLKHKRFEPILDKKITIKWSPPNAFEKDCEAWADCASDEKSAQIRINLICQELKAPSYVISYLVCHEAIHALPGCQYHNNTFWDHEISIMGPKYYDAARWLRKNNSMFKLKYAYRSSGWLQACINQDQLTIKDMSEICGCSISTIKRWLKKHGISISK